MLKFTDMKMSPPEIEEQLRALFKRKYAGRKTIRKSEAQMTKLQKERFLKSMKALIKDGWYNEHVNIHGNMMHRMHTCNMMTGRCDIIAGFRFLPWHRVYLLKLEEKLQEVDKYNFIPYWRWTRRRRFPNWLKKFEPKNLVNRAGETYSVYRSLTSEGSELPTKKDIRSRLENKDFRSFSMAIEGMEPRGAHNLVHGWVGGTMNTMYSPADPIFWMHHAECDRLWYIWQQDHPDQHPPLMDNDAIMDPWATRYKDISNTSALSYTYKSLSV